jgi:serine/threonine protein kinase
MLGTLDHFTRKLSDSGLMSVEQLESFYDTLPPDQKPEAADQLSRKLVENKVLTEFQLNALSSGDPNPLVIGDYVILEKIGEGGMGIVFKAQHRRMKRTVALKKLTTEVCEDDSALRRFERELEVAAKLNHHNIVAALDAREEQGAHYLIMEYVEGRVLSTIVDDEGALPVHKAVDYVLQAATGCAHAHG